MVKAHSAILVVLALIAVANAFETLLEDEFQAFKTKFNKRYASVEDEIRALRIFSENRAIIREMRLANPEASFGFTQFSDMSQDAFLSKLRRAGAKANSVIPHEEMEVDKSALAALPSELNWVTRGAVTPVQTQGDCASDWAMAAVANIEGVNFVKNGQLTPLSIEELMSCTTDNGCDGGITENAFEWLLQKQGGNIMTAASWPMNDGASNCTFVWKTVGATISSYKSISQSEAALQLYTATYGPIAVGVDALSWQFYTGGVMTNCSSSQIDHMVTVVGYNDNAATPYWILKNSWGTSFGMNGYVWIQKGVNACGIKEMPITAVAAKY